jgi:hypothetical protein
MKYEANSLDSYHIYHHFVDHKITGIHHALLVNIGYAPGCRLVDIDLYIGTIFKPYFGETTMVCA